MGNSSSIYALFLSLVLTFIVSTTLLAAQHKPADTLMEKVKLRLQNAQSAITARKFDLALINLNKAKNTIDHKEKLEEPEDLILLGNILLTSIDLHYQIDNLEKASSDSEKTISILEKIGAERELARAYN